MPGRIHPFPTVLHHPVYLPSDGGDLSSALNKISGHFHPVFVQSSLFETSNDYGKDSCVVYISLEEMNRISIDENLVQVGPTVKSDELITALKKHQLFLPLSLGDSDTILDELTASTPGFFDRSIGKLSGFIRSIQAVRSDGESMTLAPGETDELIKKAFKLDDHSITVTSITFNAIPFTQLNDISVLQVGYTFSKESITSIVDKLRTVDYNSSNRFKDVDVTLQTTRLYGGLPISLITVASRSKNALSVLNDLKIEGEPHKHQKEYKVLKGAADILRGISNAPYPGKRSLNSKKRITGEVQFAQGGAGEFVKPLVELANKCIGKEGASKLTYSPRTSIELRITPFLSASPSSSLYVSVSILLPTVKLSDCESEIKTAFEIFFSNSKLSVLNQPPLPSKPVPELYKAPPVVTQLSNLLNVQKTYRIDGFEGEVFFPEDGQDYVDAVRAYGTSSYPDRAEPFAVLRPACVNDIYLTIQYAKEQGKKVVARSGGHQYSCLSTGDNSVVVLDMHYFYYAYNDDHPDKNLVTAGSRTVLTQISNKMLEDGLSVPHGECPYVAVGGHTQSGGYGHTMRSFGFLVDYVYSFRIVLADQSNDTPYKTIYRPDVAETLVSTDGQQDNNELYKAVLGGGPGSFGVVTEFTYEAIDDNAHPESTGSSRTYFFTKTKFRQVMETVQRWTKEIDKEDEQTDGIENGEELPLLPDDADIMCSAISLYLPNFSEGSALDRAPELLDQGPSDVNSSTPFGTTANVGTQSKRRVELNCGHENGTGYHTQHDKLDEISSEGKLGFILVEQLYGDNFLDVNGVQQPNQTMKENALDWFQALTDKMGDDDKLDFSTEEHHTLSYMCNEWVRNTGTTTDGREFKEAYCKRLNGTKKALTDTFVDEFVDIVTDAIRCPEVFMVFQMGLGGGQGAGHLNKNWTGLSHRDVVFNVVFDVFYTEGNKHVAENYQQRMKDILDRSFDEQDNIRLLWGSYGSTDMNEVYENYYDIELYEEMQQIKQKFDGDDLFHTEFTVQLPQPSQIVE